MNDAETTKAVKARLLGRVTIWVMPETDLTFACFVVSDGGGPTSKSWTFPFGGSHSEAESWVLALQYARETFPGRVIFGPPGYDTEL